MGEEIIYLLSALAVLLVILISAYMLRAAKGMLGNSFKIIILGSIPLLAVRLTEWAALTYGGATSLGDIRVVVIEQAAQIIAALSVFAAIYLIRKNSMAREGWKK